MSEPRTPLEAVLAGATLSKVATTSLFPDAGHISPEELALNEPNFMRIGGGAFGDVYLVLRWQSADGQKRPFDNGPVVVKVLKGLLSATGGQDEEQLRREANAAHILMHQVGHAVPRVHALLNVGERFALLMEYIELGSLASIGSRILHGRVTGTDLAVLRPHVLVNSLCSMLRSLATINADGEPQGLSLHDVSSMNIGIRANGTIALFDLGPAALWEEMRKIHNLRRPYTPPFSSKLRLRQLVDELGDLFSAGLAFLNLYCLLLGCDFDPLVCRQASKKQQWDTATRQTKMRQLLVGLLARVVLMGQPWYVTVNHRAPLVQAPDVVHCLFVWFLLLWTFDDGLMGERSRRLGHAAMIDLADQLAALFAAIQAGTSPVTVVVAQLQAVQARMLELSLTGGAFKDEALHSVVGVYLSLQADAHAALAQQALLAAAPVPLYFEPLDERLAAHRLVILEMAGAAASREWGICLDAIDAETHALQALRQARLQPLAATQAPLAPWEAARQAQQQPAEQPFRQEEQQSQQQQAASQPQPQPWPAAEPAAMPLAFRAAAVVAAPAAAASLQPTALGAAKGDGSGSSSDTGEAGSLRAHDQAGGTQQKQQQKQQQTQLVGEATATVGKGGRFAYSELQLHHRWPLNRRARGGQQQSESGVLQLPLALNLGSLAGLGLKPPVVKERSAIFCGDLIRQSRQGLATFFSRMTEDRAFLQQVARTYYPSEGGGCEGGGGAGGSGEGGGEGGCSWSSDAEAALLSLARKEAKALLAVPADPRHEANSDAAELCVLFAAEALGAPADPERAPVIYMDRCRGEHPGSGGHSRRLWDTAGLYALGGPPLEAFRSRATQLIYGSDFPGFAALATAAEEPQRGKLRAACRLTTDPAALEKAKLPVATGSGWVEFWFDAAPQEDAQQEEEVDEQHRSSSRQRRRGKGAADSE